MTLSSQTGLEGAALCFRNLQCRSGTGMVLSAFLDGDFAELMLSFCIPLGPCGAQLCINKHIYIYIDTHPPPREQVDLCPNVVIGSTTKLAALLPWDKALLNNSPSFFGDWSFKQVI